MRGIGAVSIARLSVGHTAHVVATVAAISLVLVGADAVAETSGRAPQASAHADTKAPPDVTARPDAVSAGVSARLVGHRVEVTDARTDAMTTYANPDGTFTQESATGPVRVRQAGGWADVDPTLSVAGGRVAPKAAEGGVSFSAGGSGDLVDLSAGGQTIGYGWPARLPAPTLSGATATYANVVPNGDLLLTATTTGYEVSLRLRAAPASALSLRLPLNSHGLTLAQDPASGALSWTTAGGAQVAYAPAPEMYDSTATDPGAPAAAVPVGSQLVGEGTAAALVLTPDQGWLTDPARTYPVTVDPATTLTTDLDTYVDSGNPDTNHLGDSTLYLGSYNGTAIRRAFMNFRFGALKGRHILSATLHLTQTFAGTCTAEPLSLWTTSGPAAADTTYNTDRPYLVSNYGGVSVSKGYSASCPAGAATCR